MPNSRRASTMVARDDDSPDGVFHVEHWVSLLGAARIQVGHNCQAGGVGLMMSPNEARQVGAALLRHADRAEAEASAAARDGDVLPALRQELRANMTAALRIDPKLAVNEALRGGFSARDAQQEVERVAAGRAA